MKIPFILITIITLLSSCSKKQNTTLSGSIKGLRKGTLYLQQIKDSTLITIDSVALNGSNQFNFDLELAEPDVFSFYLDKKDAQQVIDICKSFNIDAQVIGYVEACNKAEVIVDCKNGVFTYN